MIRYSAQLFLLLLTLVCHQVSAIDLDRPVMEKVPEIEGNIYCFYQDDQGAIWIGSQYGLTRYQYGHVQTFNTELGSLRLSNNYVQAINQDSQGNFWVGTRDGLNILNFKNNTVRYLPHGPSQREVSAQEVRKIVPLSDGRIVLATYGGGINVFQPKDSTFTHFHYQNPLQDGEYFDHVNEMIVDHQNRVWVATENGGVARLDLDEGQFHSYALPNGTARYTAASLAVDSQGQLLAGTWEDGLLRWDETTDQLVTLFANDPVPGRNTVRRIVPWSGGLWLATLDGIAKWPNAVDAPQFHSAAVPHKTIWALFLDQSDNLWAGTMGKGPYLYAPSAHKFCAVAGLDTMSCRAALKAQDGSTYLALNGGGVGHWSADWTRQLSAPELSGTKVKAMTQDALGRLWMIANDQLLAWDPETGVHKTFDATQFTFESQAFGGLYTIANWPGKGVAIAGWGIGLVVLDEAIFDNGLEPAFVQQWTEKDGLDNNVIWRLVAHPDGKLWISTKTGVQQLTDKGRFAQPKGGNQSLAIAIDSAGNVWGYSEYLVYRLVEGTFQLFPIDKQEQERIGKIICTHDRVWIKVADQWQVFDLDGQMINSWAADDGLTSAIAVQLIDHQPNGTFLVTNSGILHHDHQRWQVPGQAVEPLISSVKVNGEHLDMNAGITVELDRDDRLEFSLGHLSYSAPHAVQFEYKLASESDWQRCSATHPTVTYPHVPTGTHTLTVRTISPDQVVSPTYALLTITMPAPWWMRWWAWLIYAVVLAGIMSLVLKFSLVSVKEKARLDNQKFKQEEAAKLLAMRADFLTQISHEIKTPLTLIKGPVEQLTAGGTVDDEALLKVVRNNANKLESLVEELLGIQALEIGQARVYPKQFELMHFVQSIVDRYAEVGLINEVQIKLTGPEPPVEVGLDKNHLTRALDNLLSNALKFSPVGGVITLEIEADLPWVRICVQDQGPGIDKQDLPHVFDQFYKSNKHGLNPSGTGVGLFIVQQIAQLHNGQVKVSNTHPGARFELTLKSELIQATEQAQDAQVDLGHAKILVVDDNIEVRQFLAGLLSADFQVQQAEDGQSAMELAAEFQPDLIVSDVMMEPVNGLELCANIKADFMTRHIPVILLTARSDKQVEQDSWQASADAFLTKPFEPRELLERIRILLQMRAAWQARFKIDQTIAVDQLPAIDKDQELLQQVMDLIQKDLGNPDLNVSLLAKSMTLHRSQLSRKISALTGLSPSDLIRQLRLTKGKELLKNTDLTVAQIAYEVGFNQPSYFNTCFKQAFDQSPGEYRKGVG